MILTFNHNALVEVDTYSIKAPKTNNIQANIHASIAVRPSALGVLVVTVLKILTSTRNSVTKSAILPGMTSIGIRNEIHETITKRPRKWTFLAYSKVKRYKRNMFMCSIYPVQIDFGLQIYLYHNNLFDIRNWTMLVSNIVLVYILCMGILYTIFEGENKLR